MVTRFFIYPLGADLFCLGKKFLIYNLVSRNLKTKYHKSFLGIFWTLLGPLSMAMVYYYVFKVILGIQQQDYLVLLLTGILPWNFFAQTLNEGADAIVGSVGLTSKVPIPLPVFPLVGALTNLVTLYFSIPILIGTVIFSKIALAPSMILIPLLYFLLFLIAYTLSYALAVAAVYLRDLKHAMGILTQVWFYSTPVLYRSSMIPQKYHWILDLNPVGQIFVCMQEIMTQGIWPSMHMTLVIGAWVISLVAILALLDRYAFKEVVERI